MPKEHVVGSYLVRFLEKNQQLTIYLLNLRTGEQLEFETWVSAWAFLEGMLEETPNHLPSFLSKP